MGILKAFPNSLLFLSGPNFLERIMLISLLGALIQTRMEKGSIRSPG